jgi:hypothetical protein
MSTSDLAAGCTMSKSCRLWVRGLKVEGCRVQGFFLGFSSFVCIFGGFGGLGFV